MTTVRVGFLTVCTWILSSGTLSGLDQPIEFCQDEHYQKNETLSFSYKYSVIYDNYKTKSTLAFQRSDKMVVAFDRILACERCKVSVFCMPHDSSLYLLKKAKRNVNATEENKEMCKCEILQYGMHFLSKTDWLLFKMKTKAGDQTTQLNDINVRCSSLLLRSEIQCPQVTTIVYLYHWRNVNYFTIFKECDLKDKILWDFMCTDFRSGFLKHRVLKFCGSQISHRSSYVSEIVYIRACCGKTISTFFSTSCLKEACMIPAEMFRFHVRTKVWDAHIVSSRCFGRLFLLVTYPQNSRTPRKYLLFVRIYRLI
ncbi:uncharacterized protein LOC118558369 [Fundulus heteroclitus]|uniref:uncharacterized protein LOC118558369 n=1 Tax=Fundulus heteroclitus TaxID=8078 RepID=UPI00165BE029|nr:uncharacterized protein LOC118558369 [Fundulus heteroclitus]